MRNLVSRSAFLACCAALTAPLGCESGAASMTSTSTGEASTATGSGGSTSSTEAAAASTGSEGVGGASADTGASSSTGAGGSGDPDAIGEWTDAPGACPVGIPRVEITTAAQLASASRGEGAYAGDAPSTCYFLHDGVYAQSGTLMFMTRGGVPGGDRRYFVGQSREGVVLHARAALDDKVGDITIENLTFDLTGYSESKAFNTLSLGNGKNITVDHVTFTGDCVTGFEGGHIETNGTDHLLVEACLIEKFGHCAGGGHLDHGVYLAGGSNLVFRNNLIRDNASRGIQMYAQGGKYGTLDKILIEQNRITHNGHADDEDGIVLNGSGTGSISHVKIQHNILDHNYYSGIRFAGGAQSTIVITRNTFARNGAGSMAPTRSEINIDAAGGASGTAIAANLFEVGNVLINNCYDGKALGFGIGDNFVHGMIPSGMKGSCVGMETLGDPQLVAPEMGDFHVKNAVAMGYGAYAP